MHLSQTAMGGDTANLVHSSALSKPGSPDTRPAIPALLLQPVWRAEHLKVLMVREKTQVPISAIFNKFNLPRDGHDDFEDLAAEITQPSTSELLDFTAAKATFHRNMFYPMLSSLHEMSRFATEQISQNQYIRAAKAATATLIETVLPYTDDEGSLRIELNSVPFHLQRIAVKGILACDGCIIKTDMQGLKSPLPVAAFSIVRPKDPNDVEAQEASQLVLQAALAFEQNPALTTCKTFAIHVDGTRLQVVTADIPKVYLEQLYLNEARHEGFEVLHSEFIDMMEVEGRREALRATFGLLKSLRAHKMRTTL